MDFLLTTVMTDLNPDEGGVVEGVGVELQGRLGPLRGTGPLQQALGSI